MNDSASGFVILSYYIYTKKPPYACKEVEKGNSKVIMLCLLSIKPHFESVFNVFLYYFANFLFV